MQGQPPPQLNKDTAFVTVLMPRDLHDKLVAMAKLTTRNKSAMIRHLIEIAEVGLNADIILRDIAINNERKNT